MCRCISELWLCAFLKSSSKFAPSLSTKTLSIHHRYSEPTVTPSPSFFTFLLGATFSLSICTSLAQPQSASSLSACLFLYLTLTFTYLPFLLLWAVASRLAYITKYTPVAFLPSAHSHRHICHISLFHHHSPDPSFTISDVSLCGFLWMHKSLWMSIIFWISYTPSFSVPTAVHARAVAYSVVAADLGAVGGWFKFRVCVRVGL